jgi:hypothetical protein
MIANFESLQLVLEQITSQLNDIKHILEEMKEQEYEYWEIWKKKKETE